MATDPSEPLVPGFATPAAASAPQLAGLLLDASIVVIGGQIDDTLANTVCSQLLLLDAAHVAYLRRLMAERIASHTGQPEERMVEDFDRDRWFAAAEAQVYGMVDVVLDHRSQLPSAGRSKKAAEAVTGAV